MFYLLIFSFLTLFQLNAMEIFHPDADEGRKGPSGIVVSAPRTAAPFSESLREYAPEAHPVLSESSCAKRYLKCAILCCFFSERWFKIGAFLTGVATVALTAVSYGLPAGNMKDNLILTNLILQVVGAALNKFTSYAHSTAHHDEKQFRMFKLVPADSNV